MNPKTNEMELPIESVQIHPEVLPFVKPRKVSHIEYTMKMSGQSNPVLGNLVDGVFYITDGVVRYEVAKKLGLK
jgi:ParB-like chromosome segregation protein Spo0J